MVGLFKYLFYRVYWWDNAVIKNSGYPIFSAVIGVSFFQVFNIKFICDFIFYIVLKRKDLIVQQDKIIGIIIVSLVLVINWAYFYKNSSATLEKIKRFNATQKKIWDTIVIAYMLITLMTTIGLACAVRNNIYF